MSWLLSLAACAASSQTLAQLPADFTPTVVISGDPGFILGFNGGPFAPLDQRTLAAWSVAGGTAEATGPQSAGWYRAADRGDGELWVVTATPAVEGSAYRLLVQRGELWEDRGPIPATSLTSIAVEGEGIGWAVGVGQLWRTEDGGASWTRVIGAPAPGITTETLAVPGPGQLVVGGGQLLRTEDGGASWTTLLSEPVTATNGSWFVTEGGRVGQIQGDSTRFTGQIPTDWRVDAVWEEGGAVVLRATSRGKLATWTSADQGQSFTSRRISGLSDPSWVSAGPALWWVDLRRSVRAR